MEPTSRDHMYRSDTALSELPMNIKKQQSTFVKTEDMNMQQKQDFIDK